MTNVLPFALSSRMPFDERGSSASIRLPSAVNVATSMSSFSSRS